MGEEYFLCLLHLHVYVSCITEFSILSELSMLRKKEISDSKTI